MSSTVKLNVPAEGQKITISNGRLQVPDQPIIPFIEGDGTGLYLAEAIRKRGVSVSRLARGLPTGAQLEYVSKAVLADAIEGRREMQ